MFVNGTCYVGYADFSETVVMHNVSVGKVFHLVDWALKNNDLSISSCSSSFPLMKHAVHFKTHNKAGLFCVKIAMLPQMKSITHAKRG